MKKRALGIGVALFLIAALGFGEASSVSHEKPWSAIADRIQAYVWNDMEEMACSLPNAAIPYRGSDTINCLNNSIICTGMHEGVGIQGFTQTNNVFPIEWTTEFSIGMRSADLADKLQAWSDGSGALVTECVKDGDIQIVKCNFRNEANPSSAFELSFYVYNEQVYQIVFAFI